MDKPLNYTVKSPVYLTLADGKVDDFKGCKVVDVTFPNIISTQVKQHFSFAKTVIKFETRVIHRPI